MKKDNEITFISLLDNEEFLSLARNNDWSDPRVQEFVALYPGQKETISYAFQFVKANSAQNRKLAPDEATGIRDYILAYSGKQYKRFQPRRLIINFSKIAAILVLVLSGTFFVYQYVSTDHTLEKIAQSKIEAGQDAVIVLSDGSKHNLASKESRIEYNADGSEIIVRDEKEEQEKLSNSKKDEGLVVNQIVVPYGHRHSIVLSDGTKVQLNSGSKLVFPAEFKGNTREVFLKGEGFFEVSKNKEKPFIVKTEFVDLKVLGTSFNISSYQDEQTVTTVLVEGKVAVYQNNKLFGGTKVELNPGQGCFYSVANSSSVVKEVDVNDFVSWKDGIFRFRDQTLKDVAVRIQKYYNKSILIESENLSETVISGKLVLSEEFDDVMNYLARTLEANYEMENENTYTFKK